MFSLICAWTNGWDAADLRRHRAHYDVTVMHHSRAHIYTNYSTRFIQCGGDCKQENMNYQQKTKIRCPHGPRTLKHYHFGEIFISSRAGSWQLPLQWVMKNLAKLQHLFINVYWNSIFSILEKIWPSNYKESGSFLVKTKGSHDYSFRHLANTYIALSQQYFHFTCSSTPVTMELRTIDCIDIGKTFSRFLIYAYITLMYST